MAYLSYYSGYRGRCKEPDDRPDVSKRLAGIISSQRRGRERPEYGRRSGRCDPRNLWRASTGDSRVFSRKGAASPTRIRLVILQDLSGSMEGIPASNAAQMVWDLIRAGQQVPTVSVEVWGHTTQNAPDGDSLTEGCSPTLGHERGFIKLLELWKPGQSKWQFHRNILSTGFSGNEDGFAIKVVAEDVERRVVSGERIVMVVVSDGQPVYAERGSEMGHVRGVVNAIRRRGHVVVSVSIDPGLSKVEQDTMYGDQNVIQFQRDTMKLTQDIARVIGRALD
jgi:cobalamin biosynthesis protein CobT